MTMDPAAWKQGGRFRNPWPEPPHRLREVLRWKLGLGPREEPWTAAPPDDRPAPRRACDPAALARSPGRGWRAVWLGHASFLLQGAGLNLWLDPVFSAHCSPWPLRSLRRHVEPPCPAADLPRPDAVLLTHGHYDHLDLPTLRGLDPATLLLVPEGHRGWLRRKGFREIREIPWFGHTRLAPDLEVHAVPARHFTARSPWDRNRGHWCGWLLRHPAASLWHAGDSGWCPAFAEIGRRFGPVDFAMLPIGAYNPRWLMEPVHITPEEAVQAFLAARCRRAVAMHWGTFRLTDEPLGEPPLRLAAAVRAAGLPPDAFRAPAVGEIVELPELAIGSAARNA